MKALQKICDDVTKVHSCNKNSSGSFHEKGRIFIAYADKKRPGQTVHSRSRNRDFIVRNENHFYTVESTFVNRNLLPVFFFHISQSKHTVEPQANTDGSFTMTNSNSFLGPYEILPRAKKILTEIFWFYHEIVFVCTH